MTTVRSAWVLLVMLFACPPSANAQFSAPELEPNLGWLNSDRPLTFADDLKGHVVLLDFWTYCCINCMHVLPDLKYLEEKYADEPFVVVGVHSAKFTNEGERQSIRHAMQRYAVRHPVVVDDGMRIWRNYGVRSWPTTVLIGADGVVVGAAPGEGNREVLDQAIERALTDAREAGTLADQKTEIVLDAEVEPASGLTFPGKVLALPEHDRLIIADSSANRVIISTYPDESGASDVVRILGSGESGFDDGVGPEASFHDPQGFAFDPALGNEGTLYVADTRNHAVRTVDLATGQVKTIAGDGERSFDRAGGKRRTEQGLASPWALHLSPDRSELYIANAGTHQLWTMDLESGVVANLVGSGRENSFDDRFADAALAQPSGLALSDDGERLYFADSESSSIRVADLAAGETRTVVGYNTPSLYENGLFEYGDIDGAYPDVRLQHALGVAILESDHTGETLLIADTYNHKLKVVDARERTSATWLGDGRGETEDGFTPFDEPGGLSIGAGHVFVADTNNHRVVMIDLETKRSRDVVLRGLGAESPAEDALAASAAVPAEGPVTLVLEPALPEGATINAEFPVSVRISESRDPSHTIAQRTLRADSTPFEITLDGQELGQGVTIELGYAYCTEGDDSVCRPIEQAWDLAITRGQNTRIRLGAGSSD